MIDMEKLSEDRGAFLRWIKTMREPKHNIALEIYDMHDSALGVLVAWHFKHRYSPEQVARKLERAAITMRHMSTQHVLKQP